MSFEWQRNQVFGTAHTHSQCDACGARKQFSMRLPISFSSLWTMHTTCDGSPPSAPLAAVRPRTIAWCAAMRTQYDTGIHLKLIKNSFKSNLCKWHFWWTVFRQFALRNNPGPDANDNYFHCCCSTMAFALCRSMPLGHVPFERSERNLHRMEDYASGKMRQHNENIRIRCILWHRDMMYL